MCLLLHSCIFPRQVTPIFQCVSASSLNWRPTMTSMQCIVSRSFEATAENTLTLASGTVLEIVSDLNPDWWYVKSQDGQEGYFPSTCCLRFATEKSLPPGWQKHMSPDNRPYYVNLTTNKTQWDFPEVTVEAQRPVSCIPATTTPTPTPSPTKTASPVVTKSISLPVTASQSQPSSGSGSRNTSPSRIPNFTPPVPPTTSSTNTSSASSVPIITVNSAPPTNQCPPKPPQPPPPPPRRRSSVAVAGAGAAGATGATGAGVKTITLKDTEVLQPKKMSDELKNEIAKFSIRGYAENHFKTKKKWGFFGRTAIKTSERKMGYATKLAMPLTVLSKPLYTNALTMFQSIVQYMDKGSEYIAARGVQLLTLIRNYDQLRYSNNGLIEELYCQLIQQTTENPLPVSVERGWEVIALFVLLGLLPQADLLNVIIGHADLFRFATNATGAFALIVHSVLCCHVKALTETGAIDSSIQFIPLSDISYEEDILSLHSMFISQKIFGADVHGVIYREMFLKDPDCLFPLRSDLSSAVPEILSLLCTYILEKGGKTRVGIFREAANTEIVKDLLQQLEVGNYRSIQLSDADKQSTVELSSSSFSSNSQCVALMGDSNHLDAAPIPMDDVIIAADALKIWFRRMPEPITTFALYDQCIAAGKKESCQLAQDIVDQMPPLHANILRYLARFLRELSEAGHVTNMEVVNLSLVFTPNCIQSSNPDPQLFASNANYERKCFKLFIDVLAPE